MLEVDCAMHPFSLYHSTLHPCSKIVADVKNSDIIRTFSLYLKCLPFAQVAKQLRPTINLTARNKPM